METTSTLERSEGDRVAAAACAGPGQFQTSGKSVLLLDDDRSVRKIIAAMLERSGFSVLVASSSQEAFRLCEAAPHSVGLLMSDVEMLPIDGVTTAQYFLDWKPGLPVILTSGSTSEAVESFCSRHSNVRFLQKPFFPDDLARLISEM